MLCADNPFIGNITVERGGYWRPYIGRYVMYPELERYDPYQGIEKIGRVQEYFLSQTTSKQPWNLNLLNAPDNDLDFQKNFNSGSEIVSLLRDFLSQQSVRPLGQPELPVQQPESEQQPEPQPELEFPIINAETQTILPFSTAGLNSIPRFNFQSRFNYLNQYPDTEGPPSWNVLRRLRQLYNDMDLQQHLGVNAHNLSGIELRDLIYRSLE